MRNDVKGWVVGREGLFGHERQILQLILLLIVRKPLGQRDVRPKIPTKQNFAVELVAEKHKFNIHAAE